jgi:threonine/homoserine/homoserine lactone efflux protein
MWAGIWGLLASLPKLLDLLKSAGTALMNWFRSMGISRDLGKYDEAAKKSKETKDTTDLDNLFGGKS